VRGAVQSPSALQTNKTEHAGHRTGSNLDQKAVYVCRTWNQLERGPFLINNRLYYHFYNNTLNTVNFN
jgi:hypothetical protein